MGCEWIMGAYVMIHVEWDSEQRPIGKLLQKHASYVCCMNQVEFSILCYLGIRPWKGPTCASCSPPSQHLMGCSSGGMWFGNESDGLLEAQ
jgi:hypothetical protein